ncbi:MAG TPA: hypothetical protein VFA05_11845 [Gaiellaceae bacterium]|nr:hypothetical protein [Gaiellaceae bacterium]
MKYAQPEILDYGSIADHTFIRCGGTHAPKDPPGKPFHYDKFNECSATETGLSS